MKMFIGIGDAAVVFFLEFVDRTVGGGIPTHPELLDEVFFLFCGSELQKSIAFLGRNDVDHILVDPLLEILVLLSGLLRCGTSA
jgi:hypothetical protein